MSRDDRTMEQIAEENGVTVAAIRARIARGSPVDGPNRKNASRPRVLVDGRTIAEIAAENGISVQAAARRIRTGTAIDGPNRQNESRPKPGPRNYSTIAKEHGISRKTVSLRAKKGQPPEGPPRRSAHACKRCGGSGHYAKTCESPLPDPAQAGPHPSPSILTK